MSDGTKASVPSRFGAFLLDGVVFVTVLLVLALIAISAGVNVRSFYQDYGLETFLIVFFGAEFAYLLFLLWFLARGQTPGKWLMDIRAVDKRNGSRPGLGRMLLRETLGKCVSGCFFGLGWLWAIWDRDAQAWHDKIVRTVVLYRPTQSRKFLFIECLFGTAVLSGGFLWASSITPTISQTGAQEASVIRVPFVGCNSDGQSGPVPAPKGTEKLVQIDASIAQGLAYYTAGDTESGVLAPRGWYCFGTYGSDGDSLYVTPQPIKGDDLFSITWGGFTGPAIQVSELSGETSGRFAVARVIARAFPAQKPFVQSVIDEGLSPASHFPFGPYPNDKLTFQSDRIVEYQTPSHSKGLGTTVGSLQPNDYPISGVAILQGQAPDLLISMVRLPPDMNDLTSHIIRQIEHDHNVASIRNAAEQGNANAQYNLGSSYYIGQGVPQDYAQAYFWLALAAPGRIEGRKQDELRKDVDDAAAHLTRAELSQVRERVRKWFEGHPTKVE